jgi:hypothetical protein
MIKRFASKAVLLTALLASSAALAQTTSTGSQGTLASAQATSQAEAGTVMLELFLKPPTESSEALISLEIGPDGANLDEIQVPETASKARYMRVNVNGASGVETFVYRVVVTPSNGRIFVLTPSKKAIALNKFLVSSGLEVGKDRAVTLGAQTTFSSEDVATPGGQAGSTDAAATGSTTTTEASTPATTSATAPEAKPADTGSTAAATAPADASATPAATAPADATATPAATTTAPADASATPAATTTALADASATPAATTTTAPADASASTTTAPAADASKTMTTSSSSTSSSSTTANSTAEAVALTEPVNATLGKVELTVVPTGATAPQSSATNFILTPITDAKEAKSRVEGNIVTLSYTSASSIEDLAKFYADQLKAQGFTPDAANPANKSSPEQVVSVYKRGEASVTVTMLAEKGAYTVTVDLTNLSQ